MVFGNVYRKDCEFMQFWILSFDLCYDRKLPHNQHLTQKKFSSLNNFICCSCQRPVFSLGVSQHKKINMHKQKNMWKFELNWSSKFRDIIMKENKIIIFTRRCVLDFETSKSNSDVSKSNSWKITSFTKNTLIQREPFLKMFYTINLSPLLFTK